MKITDLIDALQNVLAEHGDINVVLEERGGYGSPTVRTVTHCLDWTTQEPECLLSPFED